MRNPQKNQIEIIHERRNVSENVIENELECTVTEAQETKVYENDNRSRCGKSSLLKLMVQHLKDTGIQWAQIMKRPGNILRRAVFIEKTYEF